MFHEKKILNSIQLAALFCGIAFLNVQGETFYWKPLAESWGNPNAPENWDVGATGGGNAANLVPGATDKINIGAYWWDMGGGEFTPGTIKYIQWDPLYQVHVTNGTLTFTQEYHPRCNHMHIWGGAKVVFPAGAKWIGGDGMGNDRFCVDTVHAGGRVEFLGSMLSWHSTYTVEEGGEMLLDPTSVTIGTSYFKNLFTNHGVTEMPRGLTFTANNSGANKGGSFWFVQAAGVWKIGGPFTWYEARNDGKNYGAAFIQIDGGKIEAANHVNFPYVTNCLVSAGAQVELQVAEGGSFDLAPFTIGEGAAIVKTGPGMVIVGAQVPAALTVASGFTAFTAAVTESTIAANAGIRAFAFGAAGNRLDSLANHEDYDFCLFEPAFTGLEDDTTLFSSSNAELLAYVFERLNANLTGSLELAIEGDSIKVLSDCLAYMVTVAEGESVNLDSAMAVVRQGNETLENAPFGTLTLAEGAILRKRGQGKLISSDKLKGFTGKIKIEEGVFTVTSINQLGTETNSVCPEVHVLDGATLELAADKNLCSANDIRWYNKFYLAGAGKDNLGAIHFNSSNSQRAFMSAGATITLGADTLFGFSVNHGFDVVCAGMNMNGHTLKLMNLPQNDTGRATFTFGTVPVTNPGHLVADKITLSLQHGGDPWSGSEVNTMTLTNGARLGFYSTKGINKWKLVCEEGTVITPGGSDKEGYYSDCGVTNINFWSGPVCLKDETVVQSGKPRHGFTVHGVVSGPGGFKVQGAVLQLVNPENSFAGAVSVSKYQNAFGELALYAGGALPGEAVINGTTLRLMGADKAFHLPRVELIAAGEAPAVLDVNGALSCELGILSGAGEIIGGGVTVRETLALKRDDLEASRKLTVSGELVYAEGARVIIDDALGLAHGTYSVAEADGGVTFAGAKRLEAASAIARKWHLRPSGENEIILTYSDGTKIIVR